MMKNKILVSQNKVYSVLLIAILIVIYLINENINQVNNTVLILLNIGLVFIAFSQFKMDLITYMVLCIEILIIPITIQYYTGTSYGMLEMGIVPLHLSEFLSYTFIYCVVFLSISIFSDFKKQEFNLIETPGLDLNNLNILFNNVVAVVFTIVAFPRLSMHIQGAGERFNMLLPGHAWNQLAIVALLFNLKYLSKYTSVKIVYIFVSLWFLINGERADIFGLIIGIVFYYFLSNKIQLSNLKKIAYFICLLVFVFVLNMIASIRQGVSISFIQSIKGILVTPTISDVSYIFNASIDLFERFGTTHSQIFISNIHSIIPLYDNITFNNIFSLSYPDPGGQAWITQPLLDWGFPGLILGPLLDFILIRLVIIKSNSFFKMEYLALLCLVPRAVWYGREYTFTTLIFFIPLMYVLNLILLKIRVNKNID